MWVGVRDWEGVGNGVGCEGFGVWFNISSYIRVKEFAISDLLEVDTKQESSKEEND